MLSCWEVLRDAGVPDGAVRPSGQGRLDPSSTAAALREAVENLERLDMTERECLAAWLGAFRHHWPDRFEAVLGSGGDAAVQRLGGEPLDHGRYLKLRRIAIANLSGLVWSLRGNDLSRNLRESLKEAAKTRSVPPIEV